MAFDRNAIGSVDPGAWDVDGIPRYVEIGMRDWKKRASAKRGTRYGMKLFRSYLDPRFCPLTWLMKWKKYSNLKTGRLWGNVAKETYEKKVNTIMRTFMGKKECSTHSIRRSAAQWAARCGDKGMGIRNAGRWKSWNTMMIYVAQPEGVRSGTKTESPIQSADR